MKKAEVFIFVPGEDEFGAVREAGEAHFENFIVRPIKSGPGAINTAAAVASSLAATPTPSPALLIGAGLCGSLDIRLKAGEAVVSDAVAIADWAMEDDRLRTYGVYGESSYTVLSEGLGDALAVKGRNRAVEELLVGLTRKGFVRGRLLSTDTLVTSLGGKLERGRLWDALASDHESGALAKVAASGFPSLPWLNLRIVADTIGEQMGAGAEPVNFLEILGLKLLVLLSTFDAHFPKCGCESCGGLCCPGLLK